MTKLQHAHILKGEMKTLTLFNLNEQKRIKISYLSIKKSCKKKVATDKGKFSYFKFYLKILSLLINYLL